MPADQLWRLAWHSARDGQPVMRDALLTLALVESGPDEVVAAERCRRFLIARRPGHWLASFPTLGQAVGHPRVASAIESLRATFPPARVAHLLMRAEASRGPFTGRPRPLAPMLDDLLGTPSAAFDPGMGSDEVPALPFPAGHSPLSSNPEAPDAGDPAALVVFYLTVLMAIAFLLASVVPPAAKDSRAA